MADIAKLVLGMDATGTDKGKESLDRLDAAGKAVGATFDSTTKKVDEMGKAASRGAANYQVFNGSMNDTARIIRNAEKAVQDLAKEQLAAAQAAKELSKSQDQHTFSMNSSLAKMEMMRVAHDAMIGSYTRMGSSMFVLGNATGLTTMLFSAAGVAFLGVAAAAGSFVAAAIMGAKETSEFNKQMALTGGIAGTTKGQFNAMSAEIASSSHSGIGTVKEVMQGLIASGKFTGEALTATAKTAVDFAHATGESTEDVLKDFEKMSDGVTKWAEKHNEQYHFLTAAQYAQITALEEQGKTSEAVAITMQAMDSRLATATENLGYGATAWRLITVEASAFGDVMKGIGRDKTGEEKLKKYQDIINNGGRSREANVDGKNYQSQAEKDIFVKDAQVQIDFINKNIVISERFAEIKKAKILIDKEGVAATKEYIAFGNQHLENIEKSEKAEIKYHAIVAKLVAADAKDGSSLAPDASQQIMDLAAIKLDIYGKEKKAVAEKISDYEKLMISLREKLAVEQLALANDEKLTAGQKLAQQIMVELRDGVLKLTQAKTILLAKELEEILVTEKANEAKNFAIKQADDLVSAGEKELQSLDDQIKKQKEAYEQMGLTKAQIDDLKQTRLLDAAASDAQLASNMRLAAFDEKLIKDMGGPWHDAYIQYANDLDLAAQKKLTLANQQGDIAENQRIIDARNEAIKQADRAQKKWEESNKQIGDGLYSAIAKGGDAAIKKMISDLKNWFARLVLSPIISPIAAFGASLMNPGAASAQGTTGGALGSTSSLLSAGTTLYQGFTGAMAAAGTLGSGFMGSVAGGLMGAGAGSGLTSAAGLAMGEGIASTVGASTASAIAGGMSTIAAALPWVAAAAAAYYVGKAAFGMGDKQISGQTVAGNLGTDDLSRSVAWSQKGGFLRSDRSGSWNYGLSNSTAIADGKSYQDAASASSDSAMLKSLTSGYATLKTASADYAKALGINADSIAARTDAISFAIGKDAAETQANITKTFADVGDKIAADLLGPFTNLKKDGESASATLMRLGSSITTANAWLSMLGQRLYQVSLAGGDAASKLADAFGGLQNMTAASKSFYELYYSDGERAAQSTADMAKALGLVNLSMPETKDQLRSMATSLDLNTESGRAAYVTLMAIAPEFASVADKVSALSKETATALMAAFTGNGALIPALNAASLHTDNFTASLSGSGAVVGSISTIFLDATSKLLNFGGGTAVLMTVMFGAQLSAQLLTNQIDALKLSADKTKIDIAGLSGALTSVSTETFINTMGLVFENLSTRIKGVIDSISTERVALREAAIQIINPTVMGKDAIQRGIGSINTHMPSNAGVVYAGARLAANDGWTAYSAKNLSIQKAALEGYQNQQTALAKQIPVLNANKTAQEQFIKGQWTILNSLSYWDSINWSSGPLKAIDAAKKTISGIDETVNSVNRSLYAATVNVDNAQSLVGAANTQYANALKGQADAVAYAKVQQLAYADALQNFTIDASKSVGRLSNLRAETMKYYEAQKQLADLMSNSAAGLRGTVADYKYNQLTPEQQFGELQAKYASAYAMALSTDGSALAGYGDKLNGMLNPLLEKAKEIYGSGSAYDAFVATTLARADNIAGRLEALTPTNYAADSLAMLGQIDFTLMALDSASKSAEKIISDAIKAGSDKTALGLHAVIAAITGQSIPGFATGGDFAGGLRIVGENGPELEATGPSRIFNASQTRAMLGGNGGNSDALVSEIRGLRDEVANLRAEARATATNTAKIARLADRNYVEGTLVRTDSDAPIKTQVVV